jgi:hypothetical protein
MPENAAFFYFNPLASLTSSEKSVLSIMQKRIFLDPGRTVSLVL